MLAGCCLVRSSLQLLPVACMSATLIRTDSNADTEPDPGNVWCAAEGARGSGSAGSTEAGYQPEWLAQAQAGSESRHPLAAKLGGTTECRGELAMFTSSQCTNCRAACFRLAMHNIVRLHTFFRGCMC